MLNRRKPLPVSVHTRHAYQDCHRHEATHYLIDKKRYFSHKEKLKDEASGGVAQLVRACGSYPQSHWFESSHRHQERQ